jgi:hypothetical protein
MFDSHTHHHYHASRRPGLLEEGAWVAAIVAATIGLWQVVVPTTSHGASSRPIVCARRHSTHKSLDSAPSNSRSWVFYNGWAMFSDSASASVRTSRSVSDSLTLTEHVEVAVTPADQARDWKRRWREIERRLSDMRQPRAGSIGGDAINVARDGLHSFYIECYHLKDALKIEAPLLGITGRQVEDAITADPALALLADLANLDKHAALNTKKHPPRSGHVPTYGVANGTSVGTGWRLQLPIIHAGTERDGLDVARQAVDAWRRLLTGWKLL